ncbi:MAG: ABC transporter permease [Bacteroidales bacterium]|nr:ABC transporter permease [Bacteroidales bacterium]
MNKIGLIIKREYLTRVKKRSFLIMTFLGPLLMAALYIIPILLALRGDNEKRTIAVIDQSHWFEQQLIQSERQTFIPLGDISIDSTKRLVQEGKYDIALFIPATELNLPSSAVVYSMKQVPMNVEDHIREIMKNEIQVQKLLASGVDPDILEQIKTEVNLSVIRMDEGGGEKETFTEIQLLLGMVLALLIYLFIMLFGGQVMQGVMEEKSNRIVEIIVSSVKPFQLMMGKIIGVSLVALTQFLMWILLTGAIYLGFSAAVGISNPQAISTGTVMTQQISNSNIMDNEGVQNIVNIVRSIDFGAILTGFLIFFVLGYLLYATLFAAIGAVVENNTDSQQFTLPVTVPLIIGILTAVYIVNNPDGSLALWMSMIPFTSPIVMMVRIPFGVPIWQVAVSALILLGTFIGMTWVAAKIYRTGILMYGKKLSYKEIFKWLKY